LGTQIKTYRAGNNETLPFNLQVGVSKKFAHAPFRFSLVAHNLQNPALLNKEMDNQVGYNHVFYFDGIGAGYVTYAKHKDSVGTFSAGLQYISYGTFRQTSATGDVLGEFTAAEYCFQAGYA
ncbi:MAG: hypothetical protein ACK445_10335, partial [Bacteroidota bacterium]